jgi:hypothetical protein
MLIKECLSRMKTLPSENDLLLFIYSYIVEGLRLSMK